MTKQLSIAETQSICLRNDKYTEQQTMVSDYTMSALLPFFSKNQGKTEPTTVQAGNVWQGTIENADTILNLIRQINYGKTNF